MLVSSFSFLCSPAGKSTLLSVLSNAKPKVAAYAFTTLVPNLGVCELDFETTVFADVPGLIEGAHAGRGLGHEFLRHVSRAHSLVHVLDGTSRDPLYDYRAIRLELQLFGPEMLDKPQVIAYNKVDVPDSGDYVDDVRQLLQEHCGVAPESVVPISAVTGEGVMTLVRAHAVAARFLSCCHRSCVHACAHQDTFCHMLICSLRTKIWRGVAALLRGVVWPCATCRNY